MVYGVAGALFEAACRCLFPFPLEPSISLPLSVPPLQSHPEEMELIMQLACRQRHLAPDPTQQQQQQQAAGSQQGAGSEQQQQEQGAAFGPGQRDKPIVVLVGATLDEPLVEHAVEQVGRCSGVVVLVVLALLVVCALIHWLAGACVGCPVLLVLPMLADPARTGD